MNNGDGEGDGVGEVDGDLFTQDLLGCVRKFELSEMQDSSNVRAWVLRSD